MADITRLYYDAVKNIPFSLKELDLAYLGATGHDLKGIACRAAGVSAAEAGERMSKLTAAVVPISSGQGIIPGFSEAVNAILQHIGLTSFITSENDIGGIGEAFAGKDDILFSADDYRFLAVNIKTSVVADNSRSTAIGFVHALAAAAEKRSGSLAGERVFVAGLGPVGSQAVLELLKLGAGVYVYDIDPDRVRVFKDRFSVTPVSSLREGAAQADFILDATPAAGIIDEDLIRDCTVISCPGVPHGLTPAALEKIGPRFIHDVLPLGVATMAIHII